MWVSPTFKSSNCLLFIYLFSGFEGYYATFYFAHFTLFLILFYEGLYKSIKSPVCLFVFLQEAGVELKLCNFVPSGDN